MEKVCVVENCGKKFYARGMCKDHYLKWYYVMHREEKIEYLREYHKSHREQDLERGKKYWRERAQEKSMKRYLRRFGLTAEGYWKIYRQQKGVCAICGRKSKSLHNKYIPLDVDHCHKVGKVKGLLCANCNSGKGLLGDDIEILKKAVEYEERFKRSLDAD